MSKMRAQNYKIFIKHKAYTTCFSLICAEMPCAYRKNYDFKCPDYIYNDGFWTFVPHVQLPSLWSPTARHNLKTFPPAQTPQISSPQPQSTLTIPVIINFFQERPKMNVKNETIMSKMKP